MVSSAFEHWEDVVAVEDEASLSSSAGGGALSQLPNAPSFLSASPSGFSVPQRVNVGFEFPQSTASSPDIMSSFYSSLAGTSGIEGDEDEFPMMDLRYDHAEAAMLSFPSQAVDGAVGPLICEDPHLQFLSADDLPGHGFGFGFGSPGDHHHHHHGAEEDLWPAAGARDAKVVRAARRWKMLASVLKWFFIMVRTRREDM